MVEAFRQREWKQPCQGSVFSLRLAAAVMASLDGLALTRSERVIVVALSYAWCTPLFFWVGERLWQYLRTLRTPSNPDRPRPRGRH